MGMCWISPDICWIGYLGDSAILGGGYLNSLAYEIVFKLITASMMNSSNNSFLAICKKE